MISYAQNFEDVILWRAFKGVDKGTYLDIGAHDPVVDSVSKAFYDAGWRGVNVEPEPQAAEKLRQARPDDTVLEFAVDTKPQKLAFYQFAGTGLSTGLKELADKHEENGRSAEKISVKTKTLSAIFNQMNSDEIHWMKVDVEGMEKSVLSSWGNATARPWVVLVESTLPNSVETAEISWEKELLSRGYSFVRFDGLNRFYVHEDHQELEKDLSIGPNVFDGFVLSDTSSSSFSVSIRKAKQAAGRRYRKQIKDLKEEIDQKESLVEQARQKRQASNGALSDEAGREIDALNEDIDQLTSRLGEVEADRHRLNEIVTSQATALSRAAEQLPPEFAEKLVQLEVDLRMANMRSEYEENRAKSIQERLDNEHQHKLEMIKELEQRITQANETRERECEWQANEIAKLEALKQDAERQIELLEARDKQRSEEYSKVIAEHEKAVRALEQAQHAHDAEKARLEERQAALRNSIKQLEKEKEDREAELERLFGVIERQEAYFKNEQLNHEKARETLENARALAMQMYEEAEREAASRQAEFEQMSNAKDKQLEHYEAELSKAHSGTRDAVRKNEALTELLAEERSRNDVERETLQRNLAAAQQTEGQLSRELQSFEAEVARLRSKLDQSRQSAASQLHDLETALLAERNALIERGEHLSDVASRLEAEHAERVRLQGQVADQHAQLSKLTAHLQSISLELEQTKNAAAGYESTITELKNSSSWKIAAPFRWMKGRVSRK